MKKILSLSLALLLCAGAMAGCTQNQNTTSNSDSTAETETAAPEDTAGGTASAAHDFNYGDSTVRVTVDLSDGWGAEFSGMVTYLHAGAVEKTEPLAFGMYYDQSSYDSFVKAYKDKENYTDANGTVSYQDDSTAYQITKIKDGMYYCVSTNAGEDCETISKRFTVEDKGDAVTDAGQGAQMRHLFNFDGTYVYVTLDLPGGWAAEFGENATYLYEKSFDDEALAWGTYMDQDSYDLFMEEFGSKKKGTSTGDGEYYEADNGVTDYIVPLTDGLYYCITLNGAKDPDAVTEIFSLEIVDYEQSMEDAMDQIAEDPEEEFSEDEEDNASDEEANEEDEAADDEEAADNEEAADDEE